MKILAFFLKLIFIYNIYVYIVVVLPIGYWYNAVNQSNVETLKCHVAWPPTVLGINSDSRMYLVMFGGIMWFDAGNQTWIKYTTP